MARAARTLSLILSCAALTPAAVQAEDPAPYPDTVAAEPVAEAPAEAPPEGEPEQSSSRLMQEIVVTAQKREENLQDVPISVQAFTADTLDAKGITEPKALQLTTPGLQYNVFAGYSLIYIRGVGTDAFIPSADASVATYIDNVYYPFGHSLASALGSIERVEVLKGPQGTLFGRNSTGGAINIVTKQPGRDFEASLVGSRESYGTTNFRLYSSIPVTDWFSFSVSGLRYNQDNYYDLASNSGRDGLPEETSRAFSAKAAFRPNDDLTAIFGYSFIHTQGSQSMSLPAHDIKPAGLVTGVNEVGNYKTGEDAPTYIDTTGRVITADVKYQSPWFDVRFIGGHQDIVSPALADYDGSSAALTTFESLGQFAKVKTAELQVLSNRDSWGADWLQWIGGVFYIKSSAGYDPLMFTLAPGVVSQFAGAGGLLALHLPASFTGALPLVQVLDGVSAATGLPLSTLLNGGVELNLQGVLDTESTAGFAQATANLTDTLSLTLGGRYQTEKRTLAKSTTRFVPDVDRPYDVVPVFDFNGQSGPPSKTTSNFSPKAVLDWKFADDQMTYVSYSQGFKSGTYNIIAIYAPTQYVKPEKTTAYELGYKGTLLDGAMRFNAAIFQNEIKNLQVQTISLTSGGAVRFETAGKARIRGAEFDLLWELFPQSVPGLVWTAGGAYLDGKYTSYHEGSGFNQTTGLFFDGTIFPTQDFTGNRLVRTPKYSGNTGLTWDIAVGSGQIELETDVYYNDGSYFSAQNTETSREHSYYLVNAHIGYYYEPWRLRVTAFGKNINDAKYHYVICDLDFDTAKLLAPPDTYGARIQWEF